MESTDPGLSVCAHFMALDVSVRRSGSSWASHAPLDEPSKLTFLDSGSVAGGSVSEVGLGLGLGCAGTFLSTTSSEQQLRRATNGVGSGGGGGVGGDV